MLPEQIMKYMKIMFVGVAGQDLAKLAPALSRQHYDVHCFNSGDEAVNTLAEQNRAARENVRLIICEQNMRNMAGSDFLERSVSMVPQARRILLADHPQLDIETVRRAQLFRFFSKPYAMVSLIRAIKMAMGEMGQQPLFCERQIVGQDPHFLEILEQVRRASCSSATVLLRGETGTGKDLFTRALHSSGPRKFKPFVVVNCCTLPEKLFEAEMFGYKKGAFTGACRDHKGLAAQAEGGTLFIDEVGEIPLPMQAKLLRFLQFGEYQPLGSHCVEKADVRIAAATNQDLEKKVKEGSFRRDLYYRLKVLEVELPPLRKRRSDIRLLTEFFVKKYWSRPGSPILTDRALKALETYDYPGNVRELENLVQRACLLSRGAEIDLDALPSDMVLTAREAASAPTEPALFSPEHTLFPFLDKEALRRARMEACAQAGNQVEREFLKRLMSHFVSVSPAAAHAGMQPAQLQRLLVKHGLSQDGRTGTA
jgi:DNA-binding NtrC family response regulator